MDELETVVKAGWFRSESEVVQLALIEFVRRHRFALLDRFHEEDIAWALRHKSQSG
jgi:Arc/MetJ-type ribon-helix-helix transcriptional regulator